MTVMPKIIGHSLAEHREKTRRQLFAALSELLSKRGFDSLTMAEIAATAGVGRTAVYNHFPDKESLMLAYITHETAGFSKRLSRALGRVDDPIECIRVYVRQQLELKTEYHLAPGPGLHEAMPTLNSNELHEHASLVENLLSDILHSAMRAGAIPPQDIRATIPLVHACLSGWNLPTDPVQKERFIEVAQDFVLRALGAPQASAALPQREDGDFIAGLRLGSGSCPVEHSPLVSACPVHHG